MSLKSGCWDSSKASATERRLSRPSISAPATVASGAPEEVTEASWPLFFRGRPLDRFDVGPTAEKHAFDQSIWRLKEGFLGSWARNSWSTEWHHQGYFVFAKVHTRDYPNWLNNKWGPPKYAETKPTLPFLPISYLLAFDNEKAKKVFISNIFFNIFMCPFKGSN
jgi:hypothetical protein